MNRCRRIVVSTALLMLIGSVMLSPNLVNAQATPSATPQVKTGNGRSRQAPLAFGRAVHVGEYALRVTDVTPNTTDVVLSENQFNKPPTGGQQFFMVRAQAKYEGSGSSTLSSDLAFKAVGRSNVGYTTYDNSCGVIPDAASDVGELFEGGTVEFNVCWSIKSDDADSLLMYVDAGYSKDTRRWFSLDKATAPT